MLSNAQFATLSVDSPAAGSTTGAGTPGMGAGTPGTAAGTPGTPGTANGGATAGNSPNSGDNNTLLVSSPCAAALR